MSSVALLELWREKPELPLLSQAYRVASDLFGRFEVEDLRTEFVSAREAAERKVEAPSAQERYNELVFRAANGGLTEDEKSEYLALIVKK